MSTARRAEQGAGRRASAERDLVAWLLAGARDLGLAAFVAAVAERLLAHEVPLWRFAFHLRHLHPVFVVDAFVWRGDEGRPLIVFAAFRACSGRAFESLGRHRLRGIGKPVEAFAPKG